MPTRIRLLAVLLIALGTIATPAADVVGWRGDGTGRYPAATPPTAWA